MDLFPVWIKPTFLSDHYVLDVQILRAANLFKNILVEFVQHPLMQFNGMITQGYHAELPGKSTAPLS